MLTALKAALVALVAFPLVSAAPVPKTCEPVRFVKMAPGLPANSSYVNDGEPPARYRSPPKGQFKVTFGQAGIDEFCGRPPCGMRFLGCARGDRIALGDPFTTDGAEFARIARHELAHLNGWPSTHGD